MVTLVHRPQRNASLHYLSSIVHYLIAAIRRQEFSILGHFRNGHQVAIKWKHVNDNSTTYFRNN